MSPNPSESRKLDQIDSRLERLEAKIDKQSDVLVNMARTEERVAMLLQNDQEKTKWIVRLQDRVSDLEKGLGEKIDDLEKILHSIKADNSAKAAVSSRYEKLFWIAIGSAFSLTVALIITVIKAHYGL